MNNKSSNSKCKLHDTGISKSPRGKLDRLLLFPVDCQLYMSVYEKGVPESPSAYRG
jgi:hypothetical protein